MLNNQGSLVNQKLTQQNVADSSARPQRSLRELTEEEREYMLLRIAQEGQRMAVSRQNIGNQNWVGDEEEEEENGERYVGVEGQPVEEPIVDEEQINDDEEQTQYEGGEEEDLEEVVGYQPSHTDMAWLPTPQVISEHNTQLINTESPTAAPKASVAGEPPPDLCD